MAIAVGTPPVTCHHGATGPECGSCTGERTRAAAKAAGMPVTYFIRTQQQGWAWARFREAIHQVHPEHDRAECGQLVPRASRTTVTAGVAAGACSVCWRRVLGDTPRRSR